MSAAAPTQPDTQSSRSGRLLALVRKLIQYGREVAATVRQRVAADPGFAKSSFGTADLTVIFRRIARALLLAQALEARVLGRAAALDKGPRPRRPRPARRPPASSPAEAGESRLDPLPTTEQIAAEIRRRPIGTVIAEIYYNLGIMPSHPLWREVQQAMFEFGGSLAKLLNKILDRALPLTVRPRSAGGPSSGSGSALQPAMPSGTGPP